MELIFSVLKRYIMFYFYFLGVFNLFCKISYLYKEISSVKRIVLKSYDKVKVGFRYRSRVWKKMDLILDEIGFMVGNMRLFFEYLVFGDWRLYVRI